MSRKPWETDDKKPARPAQPTRVPNVPTPTPPPGPREMSPKKKQLMVHTSKPLPPPEDANAHRNLKKKRETTRTQHMTAGDLVRLLSLAPPWTRVLVDDGAVWRSPQCTAIDENGGTVPLLQAMRIIL